MEPFAKNQAIHLKLIINLSVLFLLMTCFFNVSFAQIESNPFRIKYCTFLPDRQDCIHYAGKYVHEAGGEFLNGGNDEWSTPSYSNWLNVVVPTWGRVAVFIDHNNHQFSIYSNENRIQLLTVQSSFTFKGWDDQYYTVTYQQMVGYENPCNPQMVHNNICNGDACNVITYAGRPQAQGGGQVFTNHSKCTVTLTLASQGPIGMNNPCSGAQNYNVPPNGKFAFGINTMTFCTPFGANFK
jgi:hypothetical protein